MSKIYNRWGALLALMTVCVMAALLTYGAYAENYGVWGQGIKVTDTIKSA